MFSADTLFFELNIAVGISPDSHSLCIVKVDDIFLHFCITVISIAENDEGRVNKAFTVKCVLFSFVCDSSFNFLFANLTTHIVLKIFIAI